MPKPIILITIGDPAGVGAELSVKAALNAQVRRRCVPVLVGDPSPVSSALKASGLEARVQEVDSPAQAADEPGCIALISVGAVAEGQWSYGALSKSCGRAAYRYVQEAIRLAMQHRLPAVVTAPVNKEALRLGGCPHAGHTEIFAALTGTKSYAMMLTAGRLNVIHVTTHVPMREACDLITARRVHEVIHLGNDAMRASGIASPRIAVAGLNPHSGENGLFGDEEIREICPAIEVCMAEGLNVTGPLAPDTVFVKAAGGLYDIVVAMYHDQGHIPVKLLGFNLSEGAAAVRGVNTTVGLPFVRTSVDHGTAFDIAGTGRADEGSMIDAILQGVAMSHPGGA